MDKTRSRSRQVGLTHEVENVKDLRTTKSKIIDPCFKNVWNKEFSKVKGKLKGIQLNKS